MTKLIALTLGAGVAYFIFSGIFTKAAVVSLWGISLWAIWKGGFWGRKLTVVGTALTLAAFLWEFQGSLLVSPSALYLSAIVGFCALSVHLVGELKRFPLGYLGAALVTGAALGWALAPGREGIPRDAVAEADDGSILVRCYLFVGGEDEHGVGYLHLPGGAGMPWSVGHVLLGAGGQGVRALLPGATFLPVRTGGQPFPFWTYIGGGGGDVAPVTTLATNPLMGETKL